MAEHLLEYFRDENPGVFRSHPLQVIRATTLAHAGNPFTDSNDRPGAERVVYYNDPRGGADQNETRLVLRMVQHSGGAWDRGAAMSDDSGDTEGRLLGANGRMNTTHGAPTSTLKGVLFSDYYDLLQNRIQDARKVGNQQDGDRYWVIVEGAVQLLAGTDTLDVNEVVIAANDAEGGMAEAPVAYNGNAATDQQHTMVSVIGICLEDAAHDAFAYCLVDLRTKGFKFVL